MVQPDINVIKMKVRRGLWRGGASEDGDVVVDLGPVPLSNALCDPHDVPTLLLLQLHVRIKHREVELVQERQFVQFHLMFEESILQSLVSGI